MIVFDRSVRNCESFTPGKEDLQPGACRGTQRRSGRRPATPLGKSSGLFPAACREQKKWWLGRCPATSLGRSPGKNDGRKPHTAAGVVISCSSNSCVSLLLGVVRVAACAAAACYTSRRNYIPGTACCLLHYVLLLNTSCCPYTSPACCCLLYAYEDDLLLLAVYCGTYGQF